MHWLAAMSVKKLVSTMVLPDLGAIYSRHVAVLPGEVHVPKARSSTTIIEHVQDDGLLVKEAPSLASVLAKLDEAPHAVQVVAAIQRSHPLAHGEDAPTAVRQIGREALPSSLFSRIDTLDGSWGWKLRRPRVCCPPGPGQRCSTHTGIYCSRDRWYCLRKITLKPFRRLVRCCLRLPAFVEVESPLFVVCYYYNRH